MSCQWLDLKGPCALRVCLGGFCPWEMLPRGQGMLRGFSAGDGGFITVLTAHCILLLPKDLQLAQHLQGPQRGSV